MDTRTVWHFARCDNFPFVSSAGGGQSIDHAAEIARLKDECEELREKLGKQIEERAIKVAMHQKALLQERCTGQCPADHPVVRSIVKRKKPKTGVP